LTGIYEIKHFLEEKLKTTTPQQKAMCWFKNVFKQYEYTFKKKVFKWI